MIANLYVVSFYHISSAELAIPFQQGGNAEKHPPAYSALWGHQGGDQYSANDKDWAPSSLGFARGSERFCASRDDRARSDVRRLGERYSLAP